MIAARRLLDQAVGVGGAGLRAAFGLHSRASIFAPAAAAPSFRTSCLTSSRPYAQGDSMYHGTTILAVRREGTVVMIGDGQVTAGSTVVKHHVRKVRRLSQPDVLAGFAGSTADALTLCERLETKLEEYPGQLKRASVELAKAWRTEKYLRRLDAVMIVADKDCMLEITGNGDVIEPDHGVLAVGSGGTYAYAAARAMLDVEGLTAMDIAKKSMEIAADICVYTNDKFTIECIPEEEDSGGNDGEGD